MARSLDVSVPDLVSAMTHSREWDAWLDPTTGRIDQLPAIEMGGHDDLDASYAEWLEVPRIEGRELYEWMAEFAAGLDEDDVRGELEVALDGRGAFGRFRRAIERYPDVRIAWERMQDERVMARAREWLAEEGVAPVFVRPAAEPQPMPGPARRLRIGLHDLLLLGAPDGKTELLEGRVARVFLASTAARARQVFVDAARDLCEAHGIAWRRRFVEGRDRYEVGRFHLSVEATRVDLEVDVPIELWRAFS